jgi:hypothetical protein
MLRELNVVEQRYQAVLEVLDDIPVTEVAERFGVTRQTVHRWVARYRESGLARLADRSHAPKAHPWQLSAGVEAVICEGPTPSRSPSRPASPSPRPGPLAATSDGTRHRTTADDPRPAEPGIGR